MAIEIIREPGVVDLGYTQLSGALLWNDRTHELTVRAGSGYSDLLATDTIFDQHGQVAIQVSAGRVAIERWGAGKHMIEALTAADILEPIGEHVIGDLVVAELRVLTRAGREAKSIHEAAMPVFSHA